MTDIGTESELWLRRFHPSASAAVRLVCFPHAGGSASWYHPLSAALPASVEALAVQYPGRQDRRSEPPLDDLFVLADRLADVLAEVPGPLAFFGHSMGASVSFEVARRLEARGVQLRCLFASARRAPSVWREELVHRKDDAGLLATVKELSGTSSALLEDEAIVQMIMPSLRNDYRAAETYRYRPGPDVSCPIVAVLGDADPKVEKADALEWAKHTSGSFELKEYSGGHFYVTAHQAAVAAMLAERLGA